VSSHTTPAGGWNGADEVLAGTGVDAGLAPDRGVDHAQQRRRQVHDGTPRSQVAATKPARSVVAPPPIATSASVRVNPIWPRTSQQ
jgi:hypothetical protein